MLKVASIQMSSKIGAVTENVDKGISFVMKAINEGATLICLPEMFNTGYFSHTNHWDPEYFKLAETLDGNTVKAFKSLSKKHGVTIVVPFFEYASPGVYHNSACIIEDGEVLGCYRKTHIPWSFTGWEKFYMRPGYKYPVFQTKFGKVGILICYDRDFPEAAKSLALQGAEIIFIPNGAPINLTEMWKNIVQVRAYENQLFVVGACLTGRTDEEHHQFTGTSIMADPHGNIISHLEREETILTADIDLTKVQEARTKRFLYRDRRPEIYAKVTNYEA